MTKSRSQLEGEVQEAISGSGPRRGSYPNDLIPGDLVVRRDIKGRRQYRVSHTGSSAGFTQVYARQVGDGRGQIVTFDRSQLRMV
jgi:hypothetical protein